MYLHLYLRYISKVSSPTLETRYLDGIHQMELIVEIKVPDDAPALFEKRATEVCHFDSSGRHEGSESGRKEVDTKDA